MEIADPLGMYKCVLLKLHTVTLQILQIVYNKPQDVYYYYSGGIDLVLICNPNLQLTYGMFSVTIHQLYLQKDQEVTNTREPCLLVFQPLFTNDKIQACVLWVWERVCACNYVCNPTYVATISQRSREKMEQLRSFNNG